MCWNHKADIIKEIKIENGYINHLKELSIPENISELEKQIKATE